MRGERGFTLIEAMFTIALVGLLAALAAGYSGTFFSKSRLNQVARGVYTATAVARSEAVRNSRHTLVAFETDRVVAFMDSVSAGTQWKYDSGTDTALYVFNYSDANLSGADLTVDRSKLTSAVNGLGAITPSIIFNASGYSVSRNGTNANEPLTPVTVTFQNNNIPTGDGVLRKIEITVAGAIRVTNK